MSIPAGPGILSRIKGYVFLCNLWPYLIAKAVALFFSSDLTNSPSVIRNWSQTKARIFPFPIYFQPLFISVLFEAQINAYMVGLMTDSAAVLVLTHDSWEDRHPVPGPFLTQQSELQYPQKLSHLHWRFPLLYSPNLSRASAIAWFFTMSMSPRPRQKCGKIRNTDLRMSLMSLSFWRWEGQGERHISLIV